MTNPNRNFDGFAAIHTVGGIGRLNGDDGPDGLPGTHKHIITNELRDKYGIETVIVNSGTGAYDQVDQGIIRAHPISGGDKIIVEEAQDFPIGKGGIMVERTPVALPKKLDNLIGMINNSEMVKMSLSKWYQYQLFRDLIPKTVPIEDGQQPTPELLEPLLGNRFFVKADASSGSNHVAPAVRSEVGAAVAGIRADFAAREQQTGIRRRNKRIVVQEEVFGRKWDELRGIDDNYSQMLEAENGEETELRVSCYINKASNNLLDERYYATARIKIGKNNDNWAQIDQESVPNDAWRIAETVSKRLMEVTNSDAAYFVVDVIKGISPETGEERMFVREINTDNPLMPDPNEDYRDAIMQRHLLASTMANVIKARNSQGA